MKISNNLYILKKIKSILPHFLFLSVILFFAISPQVYKSLHAPLGTVWGGGHKDITDYYGYISYIREGRTELMQYDQMTTEDIPPRFTHPIYVVLGRIGVLSGLSDVVLYHLCIFVSLILYYIIFYKTIKLLLPKSYVWVGMFFAFFAGPPPRTIEIFGKTIFTPVIYTSTMNLDAAGMDALGRMIPKPHYLVGTVLTWFTVYYFLKFIKNKKLSTALCVCFYLALGMIFYLIPIVFFLTAIGALFLCICINEFRKTHHIRVFLKPDMIKMYVGYSLFLITSIITFLCVNKMFSDAYIIVNGIKQSIVQWETQSFSYKNAPFLSQFLKIGLFYIPFIPLLYFAGKYYRKNVTLENTFLFFMFVIPVIFYFLTVREIIFFPYMRLFFSTAYVSFMVFIVSAFRYLKERIKNKKVFIFLSTCILITYGLYFAYSLNDYWTAEMNQQYYSVYGYIPQKYFPIFNYLNVYSPKYSNVISNFQTGMLIAAFTHNKAYIAHEASTLNFSYKWWFNRTFMEGSLDPELAKKLLIDNKIEYVLWDSNSTNSPYTDFLTPVFKSDDITLLKTNIHI